jgi:hypothetical protein
MLCKWYTYNVWALNIMHYTEIVTEEFKYEISTSVENGAHFGITVS